MAARIAKTSIARCLFEMLSKPLEPHDIELYYKIRNIFLKENNMLVDYHLNRTHNHEKNTGN